MVFGISVTHAVLTVVAAAAAIFAAWYATKNYFNTPLMFGFGWGLLVVVVAVYVAKPGGSGGVFFAFSLFGSIIALGLIVSTFFQGRQGRVR